MRISIAGGTGLIGQLTARALRAQGHEVVAFSPRTGADTVTGEGLDDAVGGADVVIDVTKPHTYADDEVLAFFRASSMHLAEAAARAGARHLLTLSAVGIERVPASGFYRAKVAQEQIVRDSGVPFTLVRATQFFEFATGIADSATHQDAVRLPPAEVQPIAAADVALALADQALSTPAGDVRELGGPELFALDAFVRTVLAARGDGREVVADPQAHYFGGLLERDTLVPGAGARLGTTRLDHWLAASADS